MQLQPGSDQYEICPSSMDMDIIHKVVELGMASPWVCEVCVSGLTKMGKDVKQNRAKNGELQGKLEMLETLKIKIYNSSLFKVLK